MTKTSDSLPKYYNSESLALLNSLNNKKKSNTCCKAISKLSPKQHKFICRCFSDVITQKKPLSLTREKKKELKRRLNNYSTEIKQIVNPRLSYAAKRNLILKSSAERKKNGAGIFTGIFFVLLPILIDLVTSKLGKK